MSRGYRFANCWRVQVFRAWPVAAAVAAAQAERFSCRHFRGAAAPEYFLVCSWHHRPITIIVMHL